MKESQPICKIYSRKRMNFIKKNSYFNGGKKENTKSIYFLAICIIAVLTYVIIWKAIDPIFENICEDQARAIATKITNEESTRAMQGFSYNDLFTIEKDNEGNIQMINANIFTIDSITSNVAEYIQEAINKTIVELTMQRIFLSELIFIITISL